jgi:hypothetical protein
LRSQGAFGVFGVVFDEVRADRHGGAPRERRVPPGGLADRRDAECFFELGGGEFLERLQDFAGGGIDALVGQKLVLLFWR